MTMIDGFTRVFENAFFILDSDIKDCSNYNELKYYENFADHNLIIELINWFAKNYNVDLISLYANYLKKVNSSFNDKVIDFINEDL